MADPVDRLPGLECKASGKGSFYAYMVEARVIHGEPRSVAGHALDGCWRRLLFSKSPIGVPSNGRLISHGAADQGLVNLEAAEALRWWFLAQAEVEQIAGSLCIETRLVKILYHFEFRCEELGVTPPMSSDGQKRDLKFEPRIPPPAGPSDQERG